MIRSGLRLLAQGYDLLARIAKDARTAAQGSATSTKHALVNHKRLTTMLTVQQDTLTEHKVLLAKIQRQLGELRNESRQGLQRYHLQLGRLVRALDQRGHAEGDPRLSGRPIPLDAPPAEPLRWDTIAAAHPDPDGKEWTRLDACPVCGGGQMTVVNPWNKLLLLPVAPDDQSARYDYALCHACGFLSATRRPCGSRYRFLLEHFEEVTAKRGVGGAIANPILNPAPLDDADRAQLRALSSAGVFVSDLSEVARSKGYLSGLMRDRFEASGHVDIIGSLLQPRGWRVLEVRAKTGALIDGLRRYWGADVCSMPIWESQQWLVREFYGIPVSPPIDFDRFAVPFEGRFDLIVCQHMLTHALRPAEFLAELRRVLKPGGHVYFYNEPDDIEFLGEGQSMIAHLNPLHMQTFDQASLERGLAANGFEVVFVKRHELEHICLARMSADVRMTPMKQAAVTKRIERYRNAFDRSILRLDPTVRPRVADIWTTVVERAVAAGVAEFDEAGTLRLVAE